MTEPSRRLRFFEGKLSIKQRVHLLVLRMEGSRALYPLGLFLLLLTTSLLSYFLFFRQVGYGDITRLDIDSNKYFLSAIQLHQKIQQQGWQAWVLRPDGYFTSGVAAALYSFFPVSSLVLLPANVLLILASGFSIMRMGQALGLRKAYLRLAIIPFLLFPSTQVWCAGLGKDTFSILGVCLCFEAITRLLKSPENNAAGWGIYVVGCLTLWCVRPYLLPLLGGSLIAAFLGLFVCGLFFKFCRDMNAGKTLLIFCAVTFLASVSLHYLPDRYTGRGITTNSSWEEVNRRIKKMNATPLQSGQQAVDNPIHRLIADIDNPVIKKIFSYIDYAIWIRQAYYVQYSDANTALDKNSIKNVTDIFLYMPRAVEIAVMLPYPWDWIGVSNADTRFAYAVTGAEMMIVYCGYIGLFRLFRRADSRSRYALWSLILISLALLLPIIYCTPNLGTIYRFRYSFALIFASLGIAWWIGRFFSGHDRPELKIVPPPTGGEA